MECRHGTHCPYQNGKEVLRLIGERDYLRQRIDEMKKVVALVQVEIEKLRQENQRLKEERGKLGYQLLKYYRIFYFKRRIFERFIVVFI
jgi:predicted nuclease with TOPRIM domain